MNSYGKNSLDLLRLFAASIVLFSHQYALNGLGEPSFLGWNSFGGAGVTVFFFLSGMLIWTSWARDAHWGRFFRRRALRVLPALWVVVLLSVFVLGPLLSDYPIDVFFSSSETWRYTSTALLVTRNVLPGVFSNNPLPNVINGSLWTLPVEFFCYFTVAVLGSLNLWSVSNRIASSLIVVTLLATYASLVFGVRFTPHFEMLAVFWFGVAYGYCRQLGWGEVLKRGGYRFLLASPLLLYLTLGDRGVERFAMLCVAALLVHAAMRCSFGAKITDRLGDLSYGVYIFAFPIQQCIVHLAGNRHWSFEALLGMSFLVTFALAFVSWHLIEKPALSFKPRNPTV